MGRDLIADYRWRECRGGKYSPDILETPKGRERDVWQNKMISHGYNPSIYLAYVLIDVGEDKIVERIVKYSIVPQYSHSFIGSIEWD